MHKLPFPYGQVVTAENFCGRKELIEQLCRYVDSGQNVVLQGERRVGKTSLVVESVRRIKQRRLLRVNLMEVKDVDDLCKRILKELLALEKSGPLFERLSRMLNYLRPRIEFSMFTGKLTIVFDPQVRLEADSIPEVLALLETIHAQTPLAVFLDEFQDVLKIEEAKKALALMRGTIQHQGEIPYLFAGSMRNRMDEIFNHPDSPFFKSALALSVEPLSFDEFGPFLQNRFKKGGRHAPRAFLKNLFTLADQIPGDIQQLCDALWACSREGDTLNEPILHEAFCLIFSREKKSYELILSRLPAGSVRVLQALARVGGTTVTGKEFVREAAVSNPSAVTMALRRMEDAKIVWHDVHAWRFTNPFLRAWLLSQ